MPCAEKPCQAVHSFRHVMDITHGTGAKSDFSVSTYESVGGGGAYESKLLRGDF